MDRGEVVWTPSAHVIDTSKLAKYQRWLADTQNLSFSDYDTLWRWSVEDLDGFWMSIWDHFGVIGSEQPLCAIAQTKMPHADWFPGARLNYAENMLRGPDDESVVIAYSQTRASRELSRGTLKDQVARASAGLRNLGVRPGDTVAAYLPNVPEALVGLLACASVGAVWAMCSPELGVPSVVDRLKQLNPRVFLAVDGYGYGNKTVDRRQDVQDIVSSMESLETVIHIPYAFPTQPVDRPQRDLMWDDLLSESADLRFEQVAFDTPLWVLFSSGTTGLPKALVHSHGGVTLEQLKLSGLHGNLGPGSRNFVYCTTGWVVWNVLVSSMLTGATVVLFDGDPSFPGTDALWRVVDDARATTFACGAALLVSYMREGQRPRFQHDLSELCTLTSTGSPLPAEAYRWVYSQVSPSVRLESSSGGTDVCSSFVGGSPWHPVRAGEIACRLLGVDAKALDSSGSPVVGELGELVVSRPMPSMPLYLWDDPRDERYIETYFEMFPGQWRHGDWVLFHEDGACVIAGRSDGTLNRGGVRLGTGEYYAVVESVANIADSLIVHLEDPSGGSGQLLLFVTVSSGALLTPDFEYEIRNEVRRKLSPRHVPDSVFVVTEIPYNLTGKKLEVPIKRILQGVDPSSVLNPDSMRNPAAIEDFLAIAATFSGLS